MFYFAILLSISSIAFGRQYLSKTVTKTTILSNTQASVAVKVGQANSCTLGFKYKRITGIDVPIRLNRNMEVECLSFNGRDCEWGKVTGDAQCGTYINSNSQRIQPLVCGAMHNKIHGSPGYGAPGHWCEIGRKFYFEKWHCSDETGIYMVLKFDSVTKNLECLSENGRDCVTGAEACQKAQTSSCKNKPLVCGSQHVSVWGGENPYFVDVDHWCKKGNAWFTGETQWFCGGIIGIDTPIRYNSNGDVECFSYNARDCTWGNGSGLKCANVLKTVAQVKPLVCGIPHKKIYGAGGYSYPNHWCKNTVLRFVLNGRTA
jgi:hypothetical protein